MDLVLHSGKKGTIFLRYECLKVIAKQNYWGRLETYGEKYSQLWIRKTEFVTHPALKLAS